MGCQSFLADQHVALCIGISSIALSCHFTNCDCNNIIILVLWSYKHLTRSTLVALVVKIITAPFSVHNSNAKARSMDAAAHGPMAFSGFFMGAALLKLATWSICDSQPCNVKLFRLFHTSSLTTGSNAIWGCSRLLTSLLGQLRRSYITVVLQSEIVVILT